MYEYVIFLQEHQAEETLQTIKEEGKLAAIQHLAQWHYPGEHPTVHTIPTYEAFTDGIYTLISNTHIEYVGLYAEIII